MAFLYFIAALLGLCFLWGLFWPRSQWRVLASWSRRDPDASEPSAVAFTMVRLLSGVGVAMFLGVGIVLVADFVRSLPEPEPAPTAMQKMWGPAPAPKVVDRIVEPSAAANPNLASQGIIGYQVVDNVEHTPRYLAFLEAYEPPGFEAQYIGRDPGTGFSALDSAELVLNLRVKKQCVPQQAVIIESETTVQIGVFSGLSGTVGTAEPGNAFCSGGSLLGPSLLLPVNLKSPIGEREVQNLDGTAIRAVPEILPQ